MALYSFTTGSVTTTRIVHQAAADILAKLFKSHFDFWSVTFPFVKPGSEYAHQKVIIVTRRPKHALLKMAHFYESRMCACLVISVAICFEDKSLHTFNVNC